MCKLERHARIHRVSTLRERITRTTTLAGLIYIMLLILVRTCRRIQDRSVRLDPVRRDFSNSHQPATRQCFRQISMISITSLLQSPSAVCWFSQLRCRVRICLLVLCFNTNAFSRNTLCPKVTLEKNALTQTCICYQTTTVKSTL